MNCSSRLTTLAKRDKHFKKHLPQALKAPSQEQQRTMAELQRAYLKRRAAASLILVDL